MKVQYSYYSFPCMEGRKTYLCWGPFELFHSFFQPSFLSEVVLRNGIGGNRQYNSFLYELEKRQLFSPRDCFSWSGGVRLGVILHPVALAIPQFEYHIAVFFQASSKRSSVLLALPLAIPCCQCSNSQVREVLFKVGMDYI